MLCVCLAVAGLTVYAQDQQTSSKSSTGTNAPTALTGTVKSYDAGKSIEIDAQGKNQKFDLAKSDTTYTISPDVRVGSEVSVMERTDATGHKMVSIEPSDKVRTNK